MEPIAAPIGDKAREAIDSLRGYVYQIYQSALAWMELDYEELLFLEVAEDYAVVARDALKAVQVKDTHHNVTINSDDIVASIDSFVDLQLKNPELKVKLRHLTVSNISVEKKVDDRVEGVATLKAWRQLSKAGDIGSLRSTLKKSKLSKKTKDFMGDLDDESFRSKFLKRIHFDCGAPEYKNLVVQVRAKIFKLLKERGGLASSVDNLISSIVMELLTKSVLKENRYLNKEGFEILLERATQVSISRGQLERQNQLVNQALSVSIPGSNALSSARLISPKAIDEVPLPNYMASRNYCVSAISNSLAGRGVSWIYGPTGVGKTTIAKVSGSSLGGLWISANFRGFNSEQIGAMLSEIVVMLTDNNLSGVLLDDVEHSEEPIVSDNILHLLSVSDRLDLPVLITSSAPPASDFLYGANLPESVGIKIENFSQEEISEILVAMKVGADSWSKYIYVVSGGGHPQLAVAAIQWLQKINWDLTELKTLDSLLVGNPALEQVKKRSRARLLNELPEGARRLLERLSLTLGGFRRELVLDVSQISPLVSDGGLVFDGLVGSWIDQQETNRFALSPLLSNLALNTLTEKQKEEVNYSIAESLLRSKSIDPIEANSALLAAWAGKNEQVIIKICGSILTSDDDELKMLASHLTMITLMRTDTYAYDSNHVVSQMFRGAQLVLICRESSAKDKFEEVYQRFKKEGDLVGNDSIRYTMDILVYSKLLSSRSGFGPTPKFLEVISSLHRLVSPLSEYLPPDLFGGYVDHDGDKINAVSFLFVNQVTQIESIKELVPVFNFLDSCEPEFREALIREAIIDDLSVDMLVSNAWLNEDRADTIDPEVHSEIFSSLESYAAGWGIDDLAVSCRKHQVIIVDEYGGDKNQALLLVDEGLRVYGATNSELVRAKAKILYRADDHFESLELSRDLIDGDANLSEVEKAFLGRDAAISAEHQRDYITARRYYLYGGEAAGNSNVPEMKPMKVGMMVDAAIASWHAGDRESCLKDFVVILKDLVGVDPKSSIRAAHCHAVSRHVLLWLDQEASGEERRIGNGEETKIYPGVVSNPEPHAEIGDRPLLPIEMAWYMLASIENHCFVDVGISERLNEALQGKVLTQGETLIAYSRIKKSIKLIDIDQLGIALSGIVAVFSYHKSKEGVGDLDSDTVTFQGVPSPSQEQKSKCIEISEQYILCFIANSIFLGKSLDLSLLVKMAKEAGGFVVRDEFLECLDGKGQADDFSTSLALQLVMYIESWRKVSVLPPRNIFEIAFKVLMVSQEVASYQVISEAAFEWLRGKWNFIWGQQRFLLIHPMLHEKPIREVLSESKKGNPFRVIEFLEAILPVMGIGNQHELDSRLRGMKDKLSL